MSRHYRMPQKALPIAAVTKNAAIDLMYSGRPKMRCNRTYSGSFRTRRNRAATIAHFSCSACPLFNSFNYLWICLLSVFGCLVFFFVLIINIKKNPKTLKIFKKTKIFYFGSCFIFLEDYINYNISLLI